MKKANSNSLEEKISRMVALHAISFKTIADCNDIRECIAFKTGDTVPRSHCAVRNRMMKFASTVQDSLRVSVQAAIKEDIKFSCTFDEWTSTAGRRYLNINVHSPRELEVLGCSSKVYSLGLSRLKGCVTGERLQLCMENFLLDYGINAGRDVVAFTCDGASVCKKAVRLTGVPNQLCFAHGIQLAVLKTLYEFRDADFVERCPEQYEADDDPLSSSESDEMSDIDNETEDEDPEPVQKKCDVKIGAKFTARKAGLRSRFALPIGKVRKIVKQVRYPKRKEALLKYLQEDGKQPKAAILDCPTRWNSMYDMLSRYAELKKYIDKVCIDFDLDIRLSNDQFIMVQEIVQVFQPVKLCVEALCTSDATLLGADTVFVELFSCLKAFNCPLGTTLLNGLKQEIGRRRTKVSTVIQLLVCPNYNFKVEKLLGVPATFSQVELLEFTIALLKADIEDEVMLNESEGQDSDIEVLNEDQTASSSSSSSLKNVFSNAMAAASKANVGAMKVANAAVETEAQVDKMLSDELDMRRKWLLQKDGLLQKALKNALTIPPTSVESERAFSSAGFLCSKSRSSMSDRVLSALCFLRAFFQRREISTFTASKK